MSLGCVTSLRRVEGLKGVATSQVWFIEVNVRDTSVLLSCRSSLGGSTSSKRSASAYYYSRFRIMLDFVLCLTSY